MKKKKKEPAKEFIMKKIATLNPKEKASVSGGHHGGPGGGHHHRGGPCGDGPLPPPPGSHDHGGPGGHEEVPAGTVGISVGYIDKNGNVIGGKSWSYEPGKRHGHHHRGGRPPPHEDWCGHHNEITILRHLIEDYAIIHKKLSDAIDMARSHLTELVDFKASISQLIGGRELDFETLPKDLDLDSDKE